MPFDQVMHKFKSNNLHSGSKGGPQVTDPKQAIAIMLSEKRAAKGGKSEYKKKKKSIGPSDETKQKMFGRV
jgi:hypothetical protein